MRRQNSTLSSYYYYRPRPVTSPSRSEFSWAAVGNWLFAHRWILGTKPARVALMIILAFSLAHGGWTRHVAAEAAAKKQADQAAFAAAQHKSQLFSEQLQQIMAENPHVTTAVSVVSEELGQEDFGSTSVFDAASTGKLLSAVTFLSLVEQHKAQLSQVIEGKTAKQHLDAMMIKSDDQSWAVMNRYITHSRLSKMAASLGITDYDADTNSLSAHDTALLLGKVAHGNLLSTEHRQLLQSQMARANYRGYIVPAVVSPNLVYHKIGMNQDNVHDAAIIKHGEKLLVLVIYTNGNGEYNWGERAQMMQKITTAAQAAYL